ncbi:MAG: hypothetical protein A2041_01745 [Bacteroidetes bacterium GWA2_31_9b]|nr:MAG: hypothetical protein A2041_01745 [Bacteroidetes bacterium GWA2_31_9b]
MSGLNNSYMLFPEINNSWILTDTIKTNEISNTKDITPSAFQSSDTINTPQAQSYNQKTIDSIFKLSEQRELQIKKDWALYKAKKQIQENDTTKLLFENLNLYNPPIKERFEKDQFYCNFLYNLPVSKETVNEKTEIVIIENQTYKSNKPDEKIIITEKRIEIEPRLKGNKLNFDWILGVLLLSFIILGFVRLYFNKYLQSLIKSSISFQESTTMFREKNTLMEKASLLVNLLFLSNISIFVIQLAQFFNIEFGKIKHYYVYLIVFSGLILLYIFRGLTSWFVGFVFLKEKIFKEYFHNVNIYTKNTGLFLFPIVITLQFLSYEYLAFIIYIGLAGVGVLYILLIQRSFQLINRKNVSVFYMILYLCAFEFAPLLIIYKLLLSLN